MTAAPDAGGQRRGTFWVLEDPPPAERPRWFCHWEGASAPGFDSVEAAVEWGLARARTVIVRTLGTVFYWAGERPSDWDEDDRDLRGWPPPPAERQQIEREYEAELAAVHAEAAAREAYEQERERWLAANAPQLVGRGPAHECLVFLPGDEDGPGIEFEELTPEGTACGARLQDGGAHAFGSAEAVLAATTGRPAGDPWLRAVCAALARERAWTNSGRRSMLLVKQGEQVMFHATASANRESIREHGLDWNRMGAASGIAGSPEPELPAIFLCATSDDVRFFTDMARLPSDVWQVDVSGLWLEGDPSSSGGGDEGWMLLPEPVGPERLRLIEIDIPPDH